MLGALTCAWCGSVILNAVVQVTDCCHSGSMLDHPEQQISGDKAQGSVVASEVDDATIGTLFGGPNVRNSS